MTAVSTSGLTSIFKTSSSPAFYEFQGAIEQKLPIKDIFTWDIWFKGPFVVFLQQEVGLKVTVSPCKGYGKGFS